MRNGATSAATDQVSQIGQETATVRQASTSDPLLPLSAPGSGRGGTLTGVRPPAFSLEMSVRRYQPRHTNHTTRHTHAPGFADSTLAEYLASSVV